MLNFQTPIKLLGCCTSCDQPVFEISLKYKDGHPLEGEHRTVGSPLPEAQVVGLVTLEGSVMEVTFCLDCLDQLTPDDFPEMWGKICRTNERELSDFYRQAVELKPLTEEQKDEARSFYMKSVPIGVLYEAPWRMKV